MQEHFAGRGPDDVLQRRAVRFGVRGPLDIIDCFVSWEALERLEGSGPAVNTPDRLARFERHRPAIEAAAMAKCKVEEEQPDAITLEADDVRPGQV
ncbi:DUF1488 domain-containing protein [Ancylobacter sp. 6x-1]|uniref:DUF1488 domain-containing protein n=1 Tax=Ancylobacter crimeensis TaxID=2579147 RepID=A0ABT0DCS2_9HYPH|nr:DUF1488 family protein [Ancylobacter crimeensis]MCK0197761.1 DUF1488 domain-containing protein [Ancylobacter crimeensis]